MKFNMPPMTEQNNIPNGYKQTEIGIIPGDWEVKKFKDIGTTYSGLSGKKKEDFGKGSSYYIPFLNVLNNIKIDINDLEKVDIEGGENQNKVKKGDLFFNTSSETPEEVGMCAILMEDLKNTYLNSFCFGYRLKNDDIDGIFLSYLINSDYGRKIFSSVAQGATRYNLSKELFKYLKIPLPPLPEQQAIARILSGMDSLIEQLNRLIQKKTAIKKGTMQQLLTGQKRLPGFTGKWVKKKLGEVMKIFKGQGLSKSKLEENGKYNCLLYGELFTTYKEIIKNVNSKTNYLEGVFSKYGDILLPGSTTTTGIDLAKASTILQDNILLGGDIIILRPITKIDTVFLSYYINKVKRKEIAKKTSGITIHHLYGKDLEDLEVTYPPTLEEQQTIAQILSDMDAEIEALEKLKRKYENLKKGAMALLLTGKVRLINSQTAKTPSL